MFYVLMHYKMLVIAINFKYSTKSKTESLDYVLYIKHNIKLHSIAVIALHSITI